MKFIISLFIVMSYWYSAAIAQPVTGGGTVNYVPKFSGSSIITNSQLFDNGTNVGIGTTSPSVKFEVSNGSGGFKFDPNLSIMTILGPSYNIGQSPRLNFSFISDPNPFLSVVGYAHDNISIGFDAYHNGSTWISAHGGANFSLYKANSELIIGYNSGTAAGAAFGRFNLTNGVRFGNNGNMGIGVPASTAKLEINAGAGNENIRISALDPIGNRYLSYLNFDNPALSYHANKDNGLEKVTGEISFLDRPGTSGYPAAVRTSDILLKTAHNWNGMSYGQYLDTTVAIRATQDGGYMGIGITVPQAKLDVNGNIYCRNYLYIGSPDANTTTQMSSYKLAVNGTAIFNKAIVKLYGSWPDYVFDHSFKLLPIVDLQKYIELYKHLPDIASAKEMEDHGVDVGNTQALLLKKVEELTLYVIELNKKVDIISKENERLKKDHKSTNH